MMGAMLSARRRQHGKPVTHKGKGQGNFAHQLQFRTGLVVGIGAKGVVERGYAAAGQNVAVVGGAFSQSGRGVLRHIALFGAQVHGPHALFEPVGIEAEFFKQLHIPVARYGITALGIGNAGLTNVQHLGQFHLRTAVGG